MSWDTYACPGALCAGAPWTVARVEEAHELWQISADPTDRGFLVAAPEPICPRCGERLLPTLELKGAPPGGAGMTQAPQATWPVQSLFVQSREITVRQVRADDIGLLTGFHLRLSASTCHQRYLAARSFSLASAREESVRIAAARTRQHIALVASAPLFGMDDLVGVAELARLPGEHGVGELAVVVRDDLQGGGIGSLLVRGIALAAPQLGISTLHIDLLADNAAMRRLAAHVGEPVVIGRADGALQLSVKLYTPAAEGERQTGTRWRGPDAPRRAA